MKNTESRKLALRNRILAAQGRVECDLILKNTNFLDVFTCEWKRGDLAIFDGTIVGIEPGLKGKRTIDLHSAWVVPGFIDAHVHLESSLMTPFYFEEAVLKRGTTTAICDPHELANVMGLEGIEFFLNSSSQLHMDLWVMMSSCVPATTMETNGGGEIKAEALMQLAKHPKALGLAEMMNVPGVLAGDDSVVDKIIAFGGKPLDGHCPLLRGQSLSGYAAAGITSCHESSELEEAREKLTKGISVWIREGSVAKDLHALSPLLNLATSTSMGFCTDDRNPWDIAEQGHIDYCIRMAIQNGVMPEVAYRTSSWSVARHYGLSHGMSRVGAIAPGYQADLVVLEDFKNCGIQKVFKKGILSTEEKPKFVSGGIAVEHRVNTIRAAIPEATELRGPEGLVHVIGVVEGKIITEHRVLQHNSTGVARLSVLERYGQGGRPSNGYVQGFGQNFRGAIGSSVGHDSHNLIAVGTHEEDMRIAFVQIQKMGGGFVVVQQGQVIAKLPLPFGGLMSHQDPEALRLQLTKLKKASADIGCELPEPFLQLAFLSLPVIPALKLTDKGLVDVEQFRIIPVKA